jgi:TonB family protein
MTPTAHRSFVLLASIVVLWSAPATAERPLARLGMLDPIGTWNCLIYENGIDEDAALLLRINEAGFAEAAETLDAEWVALSEWRIRDDTLSFDDDRNGRHFRAGLKGLTLAGVWRARTGTGEWWCSPLGRAEGGEPQVPAPEAVDDSFPLPKPELMVVPRYPIDAIRRALEGHVVVCFKVDADGRIFEPRIVEQSDPIFKDPTLRALLRSHYAPWPEGRGRPARPGCRTYRFRLTQVYE